MRTVFLLGSLTGLLMFMGYLFGGQTGAFIAFLASIAMNFASYFYSDQYVLKAYNATPLDKERYGYIYQMVAELAKEYQIPMPKLWYVPTDVANAFATGRNPEHGNVAVTEGILQILEPNELRGVLAHELGHIKNRDILISTIAVTIAASIGMLANSMKWSAYAKGESNSKALLISMAMPFMASLIQMGVSRSREYQADESGAHACKDPLALASALKKLEGSVNRARLVPSNPKQAATASLFIVYPFTTGSLNSLFSTHPPMDQRIARLVQMSKKI